MPIFDHFDFLAPHYDGLIQPKEPVELLKFADLPAAGALLDAGGGTGRVAQYLRGKADLVVVADLSRKMLAEARRKDGLCLVCSPSEKLPFPEATFARIIMVDAFHHVIDQQRTADELWRMLQSGGRLVIEEPDIRDFSVKLAALGEKLALMRSRLISPPRIAKLFNYPDAHIRVETQGYTAWVIVDKTNRKNSDSGERL